MSTSLRVASFNAENLFSRARILNLRDHTVTANALKQVDHLHKLLRKTSYSATDKRKIVDLYQALKHYIGVRENRGKLFNRTKTQIVADGVNDWDGDIEFKRAKFSEQTRENTAKVIKAVKADVACLVEAEDRPALVAFNADMLDSRKFKYAMLIDGNDPRGIDVSVLSNFPIMSLKTHIYDGVANSRTFSRDCLQVQMELPSGQSLHLLCNHFKSKSGGEAATDSRRQRQAKRVAELLGDYDLTSDLVIVAGDLNDIPTRQPLSPLLDLPHLHDVLALQFPHDSAARWTYHYEDVQQIDYVLVSEPLKDAWVKAGVERRGIHGLGQITGGAEQEFDTVTHWTNAASDHGAVWAEFDL
jgi:endonuclease/exonuclease/phosphatase family metal-dependent hydrolase